MKTLCTFAICLLSLVLAPVVEAATPSTKSFRGSGGITVTSNDVTTIITIDGSDISSPTGGVSATTVTNIVENRIGQSTSAGKAMTNILWGNTVFVDTIHGDDATALRGDASKPFKLLVPAVAALQSGDTLYLRPGIHRATNALLLPDRTSIVGASRREVVIENYVALDTAGPLIVPGNGSFISNVRITNTTPTVTQACIGVNAAVAGDAFRDVVVDNCELEGETDIIALVCDDMISITIQNCTWRAKWDGIVLRTDFTTGTITNSVVTIRSCDLIFDQANAVLGGGLTIFLQECGTINLIGSHIVFTNASSSPIVLSQTGTAALPARFNAQACAIDSLKPFALHNFPAPKVARFQACAINTTPLSMPFTTNVTSMLSGRYTNDLEGSGNRIDGVVSISALNASASLQRTNLLFSAVTYPGRKISICDASLTAAGSNIWVATVSGQKINDGPTITNIITDAGCIELVSDGANFRIINTLAGGALSDVIATNIANKQQGSSVLTNLIGTVGRNVTNVVSLSTSNAASRPLTNSYAAGVLTIYGLEAGVNVTLTDNGSNIVITGSAGGSAGNFNVNQFSASSTHTNIKSGAFQTNANFWGDGTNAGNFRVTGEVRSLGGFLDTSFAGDQVIVSTIGQLMVESGVSSTTLGYLESPTPVTSGIQNQLNAKVDENNGVSTNQTAYETFTIPGIRAQPYITLPATLHFNGTNQNQRTNAISGTKTILLTNLTIGVDYRLLVDARLSTTTNLVIAFTGFPYTFAVTNGLTEYVIQRISATETNITVIVSDVGSQFFETVYATNLFSPNLPPWKAVLTHTNGQFITDSHVSVYPGPVVTLGYPFADPIGGSGLFEALQTYLLINLTNEGQADGMPLVIRTNTSGGIFIVRADGLVLSTNRFQSVLGFDATSRPGNEGTLSLFASNSVGLMAFTGAGNLPGIVTNRFNFTNYAPGQILTVISSNNNVATWGVSNAPAGGNVSSNSSGGITAIGVSTNRATTYFLDAINVITDIFAQGDLSLWGSDIFFTNNLQTTKMAAITSDGNANLYLGGNDTTYSPSNTFIVATTNAATVSASILSLDAGFAGGPAFYPYRPLSPFTAWLDLGVSTSAWRTVWAKTNRTEQITISSGAGDAPGPGKVWTGVGTAGAGGWSNAPALSGSVQQTNFVMNQIYTNSSTQPILIRASAFLVGAVVNGNSVVDLMYSPTGGIGYVMIARSALTTTLTGFAVNQTNDITGVITNQGNYYFTNTSSGAGNSAGVVDGTGQIVTIGGAGTTISGAVQTIAGAGNGNTNYLITLSANSINDFCLGSSNVHIYTVAGGTIGSALYWNAHITNLSAISWGINFSSATNRWRWSGVYGTNAPSVLTNNTALMLSGRSDGTNTVVGYTYFAPGL